MLKEQMNDAGFQVGTNKFQITNASIVETLYTKLVDGTQYVYIQRNNEYIQIGKLQGKGTKTRFKAAPGIREKYEITDPLTSSQTKYHPFENDFQLDKTSIREQSFMTDKKEVFIKRGGLIKVGDLVERTKDGETHMGLTLMKEAVAKYRIEEHEKDEDNEDGLQAGSEDSSAEISELKAEIHEMRGELCWENRMLRKEIYRLKKRILKLEGKDSSHFTEDGLKIYCADLQCEEGSVKETACVVKGDKSHLYVKRNFEYVPVAAIPETGKEPVVWKLLDWFTGHIEEGLNLIRMDLRTKSKVIAMHDMMANRIRRKRKILR
jgi:hypothetical protein